jgi:hypothetical protein
VDYRRYYLLIDWPHWARAALVIIIAVIIAIALLLFLPDASGQTAKSPYCAADEAIRERVRGIMLDALDLALQDQFQHLYLTWLKDSRSQPERARAGVQLAITAHKEARTLASEWLPPLCPAQ